MQDYHSDDRLVCADPGDMLLICRLIWKGTVGWHRKPTKYEQVQPIAENSEMVICF